MLSATFVAACDGKVVTTIDPDLDGESAGNPTTIELDTFTGNPATLCVANSTGGTISYSGYGILSYHAVGYNGSADPGAGGNNIKTKRTTGDCSGTTASRSRVKPSDYGEWDTNGGIGTYSQCYSSGCGSTDSSSCSGTYQVEISQPPSTITNCADFDDGKIINELKNLSAERVVEEDHTCSAGSGSFTLMPLGMHNRDGDGLSTMMMLPVMTDGTGTMTMNAWVTELTVVNDGGYDLHIVDPGFDLVPGADDLVAGLSANSTLVSGTRSFLTGTRSGFAPFVIEEMDPAAMDDLSVDMTWTCGSGATTVARSQGYVMDLNAMGCGVDQKLILRVLDGPNRINWELYGTAHATYITPTVNGSGGRDFSLAMGLLQVAGTVTSWTSTQASVDFATLEYDGFNICTEGVYTLSAE